MKKINQNLLIEVFMFILGPSAKRKIFGGGKIFLFACGFGQRLGSPPSTRSV
jgi:hypothetical protein